MRHSSVALIALTLLVCACTDDVIVDRPPPKRVTDELCQLNASKIDILFVIDDSQSMQEEQIALGENFDHFLRFLDPDPDVTGEPGEVDYRIAVTTTNPLNDGALKGEVKIIKPGKNALSQFQQNIIVGIGGSSHEEGLRMGLRGLEHASAITSGGKKQFLRSDDRAFLYVIFVTDEEDSSVDFVEKYYRYYETAMGAGNARAVAVSAIAGPVDGSCATATPGERYNELAKDTGGVFGNICTTDWAATLEELAVKGIGLRKEFALTYPPKDIDGDGFDESTSRDILVQILYPCDRAEYQSYLDACAPKDYQTDECEGHKATYLGLGCTPLKSRTRGWSYDDKQHVLNFAPQAAPGPSSCVMASYFKRDDIL